MFVYYDDSAKNGDPLENLNGLINQLSLDITGIEPYDSEKVHGLYNVTTTKGFNFIVSANESYAFVYDLIEFMNARAEANKHSPDFQESSEEIRRIYKERKEHSDVCTI